MHDSNRFTPAMRQSEMLKFLTKSLWRAALLLSLLTVGKCSWKQEAFLEKKISKAPSHIYLWFQDAKVLNPSAGLAGVWLRCSSTKNTYLSHRMKAASSWSECRSWSTRLCQWWVWSNWEFIFGFLSSLTSCNRSGVILLVFPVL